jgi:hypothetical protein
MDNLIVVAPFALVGLVMIAFGLVLNYQGTVSARRLNQKAKNSEGE